MINTRIKLMTDSAVAFGTSGVRGLVSEMSDVVCAGYTTAFLQALQLVNSGQSVALGIDLRPSSPTIAQTCAAAIRQAGCEVIYCGSLPTPALALFSLNQGIPAIMITGSHIPFDRNGIKFYRADGEISKADELAITERLVNINLTCEPGELPAIDSRSINDYIARYTSLFDKDFLKGWRIGVYEHSSVARDCIKDILVFFGAEVISLNRTDIFVPIDTEAVSPEDRQRGLDWANQFSLNAIISTDGDGDRPLIADENGAWLRGDIVGLLCAKFLGVQTVVTPVSCNTAIELSMAFQQVVRTRIGSPYVIAGMASITEGSVAGFEANGGFLAGQHLKLANGKTLSPLPTRDAVLPALAILAMAKQQNLKISDLLLDLPHRFTASDRLQNVPMVSSQSLIESLQNNQIPYQEIWGEALGSITHIDTTDGLRLSFTQGEIIHLRPSGNAPELRCYAEADSMSRAEQLVQITLNYICNILILQ